MPRHLTAQCTVFDSVPTTCLGRKTPFFHGKVPENPCNSPCAWGSVEKPGRSVPLRNTSGRAHKVPKTDQMGQLVPAGEPRDSAVCERGAGNAAAGQDPGAEAAAAVAGAHTKYPGKEIQGCHCQGWSLVVVLPLLFTCLERFMHLIPFGRASLGKGMHE